MRYRVAQPPRPLARPLSSTECPMSAQRRRRPEGAPHNRHTQQARRSSGQRDLWQFTDQPLRRANCGRRTPFPRRSGEPTRQNLPRACRRHVGDMPAPSAPMSAPHEGASTRSADTSADMEPTRRPTWRRHGADTSPDLSPTRQRRRRHVADAPVRPTRSSPRSRAAPLPNTPTRTPPR